MDFKKKIEQLRKEIIEHNRLYYTLGDPKISDSKYDALIRELKELEAAHPDFFSSSSPTQTVGAPIPIKFVKVKHTAPMLSLGSVHDEEGANHFDQTSRKESENIDYVCEPKLDGLSIELVYENGKFVRGSTRGDGKVGEDVTLNLRTIESVPKELNAENPPKSIAVRGEVMMHITDFQALNKKQAASGKEPFANPRNVAAGSMRQLDWRITKERKLHVYCYRILAYSGEMPASQIEALELLKDLGFKVSPNVKKCETMKSAIKYHHQMEEERDDLDYEIDGVVIKVNSILDQEKLGMRTTNPKWAVAYKFRARKEITKVEDIVIQVGRTGVLTPLALLKPVEVGGVTVSRASLHNMDQIERIGVKKGDYVRVERAGDVIPYVSKVVEDKRTGMEKAFHMPKKCPSCGGPIVKEDVFYRCPAGLTCPAQVIEEIIHYSSKGACDIEGFSEKTAELLYEKGIIKGISDIYGLKRDDLLALPGWKEKKTDNILKAIERAKELELERFIFGLGIRTVGKHIALLLADKFGTLEKIKVATSEELMEVNEIGPEIAERIIDFFSSKKNLEELKKLEARGLRVKAKKKKTSGKLLDKKIVFTGTLTTMTRGEAQKLAQSLGAVAQSSVGEGTDILVAGDKAGSKLKKAREKGIQVMTEEEFRDLLGL